MHGSGVAEGGTAVHVQRQPRRVSKAKLAPITPTRANGHAGKKKEIEALARMKELGRPHRLCFLAATDQGHLPLRTVT